MDANRKLWNQNQGELQQKLPRALDFENTIRLLLIQHAMVHSAAMAQASVWSFEDEIWQDMSEETARCVPPKHEHSIVWVMWHIGRIEDVTMNILVAGRPQVLSGENWSSRMNAPLSHTGNAISQAELAKLNTAINIDALRAYRAAVGRRTQDIIRELEPETVRQKVDSARIQQLIDERVVVEAAHEIVEYWSKRTITGLLLMPATRHNLLHLNEASRIKRKIRSTQKETGAPVR